MPRPYNRPVPNTWWLQRWPYTKFMLREISSVFIALYLVILLGLIQSVDRGQAAYEQYLSFLKSPLMVLFHVIALAFVLFHTITWFDLTGKVMVIQRGEERVPPAVVAGSNYVAWIVLSLVIAWIFLA